MWPLMEVDDLVGAAFLPTDGQVNPSDISQAMAKGARMRGVRCIEDCAVEDVLVENGRAVGVRTQQGEIRCEVVVNCAGMWAREIGALAGVSVPVVPVQHQFMVSEPIEGSSDRLAHAARPRPPGLLQGGGRRPGHGRLRAQPDALGARRHPRRLDLQADRARTGITSSSWRSRRLRACPRSKTRACGS